MPRSGKGGKGGKKDGSSGGGGGNSGWNAGDRKRAEQLLKKDKKNKQAKQNKRSSIELARTLLPLMTQTASSQPYPGESGSAHKRRQALGEADTQRHLATLQSVSGFDSSDDSDESDDSKRRRHQQRHDANQLAQQQQFQSSQMEQQRAFIQMMMAQSNVGAAAGGGGGVHTDGAASTAARRLAPTVSDDQLAETGDKIQAEIDRQVAQAVSKQVKENAALQTELARVRAQAMMPGPVPQGGAFGGAAYPAPPWNQQVPPGGAHAFGMGPGAGFGRGGPGPPWPQGVKSMPPWQPPWSGGQGGYGDPNMHARHDVSRERYHGPGPGPRDMRGAGLGSPGFQSPRGHWHDQGSHGVHTAHAGRGRGSPRGPPGASGKGQGTRQPESRRTGFSPRAMHSPREKQDRRVESGPEVRVDLTASPKRARQGAKAKVGAARNLAAADVWQVAKDEKNGINDDFTFEYGSLPVTMDDDAGQVEVQLPVIQVAKIYSEYERVFDNVLKMAFGRSHMAHDGKMISEALIALERKKRQDSETARLAEAEQRLAARVNTGLQRGDSETKDRLDREERERLEQAEDDAEEARLAGVGSGKVTPRAAVGAVGLGRRARPAAAAGGNKPQLNKRSRTAAASSEFWKAPPSGSAPAPAGRGRAGARGGRAAARGRGSRGGRGAKSKAKPKPVASRAAVAKPAAAAAAAVVAAAPAATDATLSG